MKILALDTSTEACSAALYIDGSYYQRYQLAPRQHTALILPMCQALLAEAGLSPAGLDAVAVGRGPGAFTGLRIGCGVAQGIAFAADLPVIPISTLAAMALGARRLWGAERVVTAIDARMGEVYAAAYRFAADDTPLESFGECVAPAAALPPVEGEGWFGCGTGWGSYAEALQGHYSQQIRRVEGEHLPQAIDIARLAIGPYRRGELHPAEAAQPVYLRDQVVHRSGS